MRSLARFGLHLGAALGAMVILLAASVVGAAQVRQATLAAAPAAVSGAPQPPAPLPLLAPRQQRTIAGTIVRIEPNRLVVRTLRGPERVVRPAPGALIRMGGRRVGVDQLQIGDQVAIVGRPDRGVFVARIVTARRPLAAQPAGPR